MPVVAPVGTVVVISDFDFTVNVAAVPLKVTLVAPVRLVPRIVTAAPTAPEVGCVSTNGPRPTDRLKTVPQPNGAQLLALPPNFVPYKSPLVAWTSPSGLAPSVPSKLCSVVSMPLAVILKTVPQPYWQALLPSPSNVVP